MHLGYFSHRLDVLVYPGVFWSLVGCSGVPWGILSIATRISVCFQTVIEQVFFEFCVCSKIMTVSTLMCG